MLNHSARSGGIIGYIFDFLTRRYYMFLLESPHRGDSTEYTQNTSFNIKTEFNQNHPKSAAAGYFFPKDSRKRSE